MPSFPLRTLPAVSLAWRAWFACLSLLLVATGCDRQVAPPLVEITELTPHEIEPGDRLEVVGVGLPQGRTGRVVLEGTVFRPGETPVRGVRVEVDGTVTTPDRLEVVVRADLAERFCGRGDRAAHATFRGDAVVSFASNDPGAPPLVGVRHGISLDVFPAAARASVLDARAAEGRRVLSFLGIVPGGPTPRGLPIEQVRPRSIAEQSGIEVGDVLVDVDGVHALSLGDVAPASARAAELLIRHGASGVEESRTVSLLEYSGERVPSEYGPALIVVGLALAILLILVLPGPSSLAMVETMIARGMRRTTFLSLVRALLGGGRHAAISVLVSAIIAAFALMPYVLGLELDGLVLLVAGSAMLAWSRVAAVRGAMESIRATLQLGTLVLVLGATMALAVGQFGAISLAEMVRAQGGAPWQFAAARQPSCAVLATVYAVAIIAILRTKERATRDAPAYAILLERAGLLLLAAFGVATFLGGWQLPGASMANADTKSTAIRLLAAAMLVSKTWVTTALLIGASRVATAYRRADLPRLVLRRLLPGLVVAGGLILASRRLVPSAAVETAFGATAVALASLFVVRTTARVRAALARPEPHASPFL